MVAKFELDKQFPLVPERVTNWGGEKLDGFLGFDKADQGMEDTFGSAVRETAKNQDYNGIVERLKSDIEPLIPAISVGLLNNQDFICWFAGQLFDMDCFLSSLQEEIKNQ